MIELGILAVQNFHQKDFISFFRFGLQLVFLFAKTLLKKKESFGKTACECAVSFQGASGRNFSLSAGASLKRKIQSLCEVDYSKSWHKIVRALIFPYNLLSYKPCSKEIDFTLY